MAKKERKARSVSNKTKTSDIKKIKLLVTIVDRSKALFYLDLLEQFEVNEQLVVYGNGTANSEMLDFLGLAETDKAVIFSFVREDVIKDALATLQEKFIKVKNGKGIAYTIPLKSIIGVFAYQLLSNNQNIKKEEKANG